MLIYRVVKATGAEGQAQCLAVVQDLFTGYSIERFDVAGEPVKPAGPGLDLALAQMDREIARLSEQGHAIVDDIAMNPPLDRSQMWLLALPATDGFQGINF